jgi:2-polyprenyl-3-methyl-5-hydroxy-6-metoxy-1,4-benzoquinol methylase
MRTEQMSDEGLDTSNFAKYRNANPILRRWIDRFYRRVGAIIAPLEPDSVLDAGCGEGEAIARLGDVLPRHVFAIDTLEKCVVFTQRRFPFVEASRESIYELPFEDDRFDLVLCLEVLEHLERPADAVRELTRVARRDLVISVPFEPYFRLMALLRGRYVARLGSHPEHVNNWHRRTFARFLGCHLEVRELAVAFPWLIAHCAPR